MRTTVDCHLSRNTNLSLVRLEEKSCLATVETWVTKSGLAALKGVAKSIKDAYALIMDASISVGDQQLLLFLKVPAKHIGHALQHADVEVADMKVATNWPAESVKDMAQDIIDKEGAEPEYLLSDTAPTCGKRRILWNCLTIGT